MYYGAQIAVILLLSSAQAGMESTSSESQQLSYRRPLTVADSIDMTKVIDLDSLGYTGELLHPIMKSPDGKHFLIITRKGNVNENLNHFYLTVFDTEEVIAFINNRKKQTLPQGTPLVHISTQSDANWMRQYAIRGAIWGKNSQRIFFIGDTGDTPSQVYSVNIYNGDQKKLTSHPRPIYDFALDDNMETIFYLSTIQRLDIDRNKTSYSAGVRSAYQLVNIDKEVTGLFHFQYYKVRTTERKKPQKVGPEYYWWQKLSSTAWLSPSGEKAVVSIPYTNVYSEFKMYQIYLPFAESPYYRNKIAGFDDHTTATKPTLSERFVIIDLNTGVSENIFGDAPVGGAITGANAKVLWMPDGETAIFSPTFLPNGKVAREEWERRKEQPSIVSYNTKTHEIKRIVDLTMLSQKDIQFSPSMYGKAPKTVLAFEDMYLDNNGALVIQLRSRTDGSAIEKAFRLRGRDWATLDDSYSKDKAGTERLQLSIQQGLNVPPEILATDAETGAERIITDFNPQFGELTFGRVEHFGWRDAEGRNWPGLIVYPPTFQPGKRYPLVIQTKGINKGNFFLDGRMDTAPFAAQALANKEIIVLQMPLQIYQAVSAGAAREAMGSPVELDIHRQGVEGAIDTLDNMGLIDRDRVGMIGFSHSCLYVDNMITFSKYDLAAAVRTDGVASSYFGYAHGFGWPYSGMSTRERGLGVEIGDVEGLLTSPRLPILHLGNVNTALRIEVFLDGMNYALYNWDQYTFLKRLHKPVELLLYPKAQHININPSIRMDSSGGTVDWLAFWLQGCEESVPEKQEQYARWRKMRKEQCVQLKDDNGAPWYCENRQVTVPAQQTNYRPSCLSSLTPAS